MLILIGPSAVGKTKIALELEKLYKIKKVVTYTTREPRVNEVDKIDYNFISTTEFLSKKENGFFVETTFYNNNYYGTAKKDILDDRCIVLDPNGLKAFYDLHDNHIVSIYLKCDEKTRYLRMINRNDSEENAKKRILNDRKVFSLNNLKNIDYVVSNNNEDINEVTKKVYNLYKTHLENLKNENIWRNWTIC